ncbi:hypothetical protein H4R21_000161 [Coemansia helicoidea]|uniref:Uncharacterized protein n=1 Tax=Coemansia helicoidea TaxID=1286919 RepID=A0ACC1LI21_9FUNG|nr:hypothetical protein H4R21_000161 [Coemansia helicoidea]
MAVLWTIAKSVVAYVVRGPRLPSWDMYMQVACDVARAGSVACFPPSADGDLGPADYERIQQAFSRTPIPATKVARTAGVSGPIRFRADTAGVDGEAMCGIGLAWAEAAFRALVAEDAAAAGGRPRMVAGEVVAPRAVYESHGNARALDPAPLAADERIILYFHGGAYVMGSPASHCQALGEIAHAAGRRCFLVDYRLAPRHPFPAQLHDALIAYRHLVALGYPPAAIAVAGDSAGGHIALGLLLLLKHAASTPLPGALLLLAPMTAIDLHGASITANAAYDYLVNTPLEWPTSPLRMFYRPGHRLTDEYRRELQHPLLAPAAADLAGFPPTLIQVGDRDMLLDDIGEFAAALAQAIGPALRYEKFPDMVHVFHRFVYRPEAVRAFAAIADFLASA